MHVIVVGGGIAGLSTAWSLIRRGHAVTLFEQGPIPNPLGASGDHHRIIRRAYGGSDGYARLISEAFDAWDELWADIGANHLARTGFLCISQWAGDAGEVFSDGLVRGGFRHEICPAPEASARWPFLDPSTYRYATFSPEGGSLGCRLIARDLAAWLRRKGANLRENAKVASIDAHEACVVLASGEDVRADRIVVAAGAWVLGLLPTLDDVLTVQRTAVAYTVPPDELAAAWASAPVILDAGGHSGGWVLPPGWGAGLKFGTDWHREPAADPDANRDARPGEWEAIMARFTPLFSRLETYGRGPVVTCSYTFTADERFMSRRIGRTLVVSACSGHGYKFGAAVGRRAAAAVETGDDEGLLAWLQAERVA